MPVYIESYNTIDHELETQISSWLSSDHSNPPYLIYQQTRKSYIRYETHIFNIDDLMKRSFDILLNKFKNQYMGADNYPLYNIACMDDCVLIYALKYGDRPTDRMSATKVFTICKSEFNKIFEYSKRDDIMSFKTIDFHFTSKKESLVKL